MRFALAGLLFLVWPVFAIEHPAHETSKQPSKNEATSQGKNAEARLDKREARMNRRDKEMDRRMKQQKGFRK